MLTETNKTYDPVNYKTPTGRQLTCKGWIQETALQMFLSNLDPGVAERPNDLIVYDGQGKAGRNSIFANVLALSEGQAFGNMSFHFCTNAD